MPESNKPVPHRLPGRPVAGGVQLRQSLLDATVTMYAQMGIKATSMRAIAQQSGVTPALMNYYFGSKSKLLDIVIEERLMPLINNLHEWLSADNESLDEMIEHFARLIMENVRENPWLPSLWIREILTEGGMLRDMMIRRIIPMVVLRFSDRMQEAQRKGQISADLDPRLTEISLIGLLLLPFATAPLWNEIYGDHFELDYDRTLKHAVSLYKRGLGLHSD